MKTKESREQAIRIYEAAMKQLEPHEEQSLQDFKDYTRAKTLAATLRDGMDG